MGVQTPNPPATITTTSHPPNCLTKSATTSNIVYFDKTNNRFLPISNNETATTISNTNGLLQPKIFPNSAAFNLNIKTQRSVVTINPRYVNLGTSSNNSNNNNNNNMMGLNSSNPSFMMTTSGTSSMSFETSPTSAFTPNTVAKTLDLSKFIGEHDEEVIVEEEEELGHAETYANYMPSKCKFLENFCFNLNSI